LSAPDSTFIQVQSA